MTDEGMVDLGTGGGDRLQSIVVVIPCYVNVPTRFLMSTLAIATDFPGTIRFHVMMGVYADQSMRHAVKDLLREDDKWERMVILEQDMLLPREAMVKHALHTDDIVGSVYFQHAPPHQINCMLKIPDEEKYGHPQPWLVKQMLEKPALYKCAAVGLGLTSIARHVLEEWPDDIPIFRTGYIHEDRNDAFTHGMLSHDVYFCIEAGKQGREVYLDTSIRCDHLTEGWTNAAHYFASHQKELAAHQQPSKILLPYRAQKEFHVPQLAKAH